MAEPVALGTAMSKSGAAAWAANALLGGTAGHPLLLLVLLALAASLLTEAMSNAAVVALLLPVGLSLANASGLSGAPVALCIALASGLDYCLPTGAHRSQSSIRQEGPRRAGTLVAALVSLGDNLPVDVSSGR
jgi:di/tricarboxylate transporter